MAFNVPKGMIVSEAALTQFEVDFRAFVAAERIRLEDERLFLTTLQVSNFQDAIDSSIEVLQIKANSELDNLITSASEAN